jgi:hypothetical protein
VLARIAADLTVADGFLTAKLSARPNIATFQHPFKIRLGDARYSQPLGYRAYPKRGN